MLIEVAYAGVNRPDCIQRAGNYPPPPDASPIIGLEVAGTVVALGDGVTEWRLGDQVCALTPGGGYAEYCAAPAECCLPYPEGLSALEAASLPENYFTVWNNLFDRVHLQAGETVSDPRRLGRHRARGDSARARDRSPSRSRPSAATTRRRSARRSAPTTRSTTVSRILPPKSLRSPAKRGVDVILDMVGGDYIEKNLKSLALEGRMAIIAFLQGSRVTVDWRHIMMKRLTVTGSTLRASPAARKAALARSLRDKVWPLFAARKLKPVIHRVFPLAEAAEAHRLMESSAHIGKIMLAVRP